MTGDRSPLRLNILRAAIATTVLFSAASAAGVSVVLRPQPLSDALDAFAKATGYQLVYRSDLTAGLMCAGASVDLPALEALHQILKGTDLDFAFVNDRTIVISRAAAPADRLRSDPGPAAHPYQAKPEDTGIAQRSAHPDNRDPDNKAPRRGWFRRIAELFAMCGSASMASGPCAQDTGSTIASQSAPEEVIVTGTRQVGLQVGASPAPIQIVSAEALRQFGGNQDLVGALVQLVPSLTVQAFGVDMAELTRQIKLRGLSPNDVLVLVDGKRRHTTANVAVASGSPYQGGAGVDLSFIPLEAIDHVEVLTEGAAAQYGTDAIAGVINVILKKSPAGSGLSATHASYYNGGGLTTDITGSLGLEPRQGAYFNVTGQVHDHGHSSVGPLDERVVNPDNLATWPGSNMTRAPGYPYLNRIEGDAETQLRLVGMNSGWMLDSGTQLYASATYGDKKASSYENYRLPTKIQYTDPVTGVTVYPFPSGFSPQEAIRERDYSVAGGVKGTLAQWNWDLSSVYGADRLLLYTLDSANAGLFALTGQPTPSNYYDGLLQATQWMATLDLNRDFDVGLAGPVNVAYGAEYRRETYEIGAGIPESYLYGGAQSYPGFTPEDAGLHERRNYAGYVDFALKPTQRLRLDAAARYEHYSDFGGTAIGKLTGRYDFTPSVGVRGTINNGFRAPTLAEEFYSSTNVTPHGAFVQLPPNSAGGRLLGLGNGLLPEKSVAYSLGLVLRPLSAMNVSLDIYQITITDRIVGSGSLLGSSQGVVTSQPVLDAIAANGNSLDSVAETGLQLFTNGIDTRTRGADLAISFPTSLGGGHVIYAIAAAYNDTVVTRIRPTPAQLGETTLFDATALSDVTTASPKFVVDASAYWTLGNLAVNLTEKIYGKSSEFESDDGDNPTGKLQYFETVIPVTPITNLSVSYDFGRWLRLSVGANNLFDRRPPHLNGTLLAHYNSFEYGDNQGVQAYPSFSPFGINGGFYYAKALFTF